MESRVQVLAVANRTWLVSENFSPIATVEGRTSQACRFQPNFNKATSIMTTKAVVGIYEIVRRECLKKVKLLRYHSNEDENIIQAKAPGNT
jgi:hypothetical protein